MLDTLLHTGTEHPNLLWVLIPSVLAFAVGLVLASISERSVSERVRDWRDAGRSASDD